MTDVAVVGVSALGLFGQSQRETNQGWRSRKKKLYGPIGVIKKCFNLSGGANESECLVDQLEIQFHLPSIALLATVAHHNRWDIDRLAREYFDHFQSVRSTISDGKWTEVHLQKPSGHFTEVKWS